MKGALEKSFPVSLIDNIVYAALRFAETPVCVCAISPKWTAKRCCSHFTRLKRLRRWKSQASKFTVSSQQGSVVFAKFYVFVCCASDWSWPFDFYVLPRLLLCWVLGSPVCVPCPTSTLTLRVLAYPELPVDHCVHSVNLSFVTCVTWTNDF